MRYWTIALMFATLPLTGCINVTVEGEDSQDKAEGEPDPPAVVTPGENDEGFSLQIPNLGVDVQAKDGKVDVKAPGTDVRYKDGEVDVTAPGTDVRYKDGKVDVEAGGTSVNVE